MEDFADGVDVFGADDKTARKPGSSGCGCAFLVHQLDGKPFGANRLSEDLALETVMSEFDLDEVSHQLTVLRSALPAEICTSLRTSGGDLYFAPRFRRRSVEAVVGPVRCKSMEFEVPLTIECVDCLGTCHRLPREPEGGFEPGAVIPYRCEDCLDRWDIQFGDDVGGQQ